MIRRAIATCACAAGCVPALGGAPAGAAPGDLPTFSADAVRLPDGRHGKAREGRHRSIRLRTAKPRAVSRAKRDQDKAGRTPRGPESDRDRRAAVFGGLNAPGLAATDNSAFNDVVPPDATGAIGPGHYLEFVNSKVAVYDRSNLALVSSADLEVFDGFAAASAETFDVQIQYDPVAGRWLYVNTVILGDDTAGLAFGWSKTGDPTNLTIGWCKFFVSSGDNGGFSGKTFIDDFPKLGHSDKHVIFGANVFADIEAGPFLTSRIWAFKKPTNFSSCKTPKLTFTGKPSKPDKFLLTKDGDFVFSPVPANHSDATGKGYVVSADFPSPTGDQVAVFRVKGTSPIKFQSRGSIDVSSYGVPQNASQPPPGEDLDTLEGRLTQAVAHADPDAGGQQAVWTQHTVDGPGGRSVVRWYELLPALCSGATTCPAGARRQEGSITNALHFVFNAAISPTRNGDQAVIHYNLSSEILTAEIRAQSRVSGTPLGTTAGEITLASSGVGNIADDFSCTGAGGGPPCRWGDYGGASPDPSNDGVVWGSNQYNGTPSMGDPRWLTRNFALTP